MLKGYRTYLFNFALIISAVVSFLESNTAMVTEVFNDPVKAKLAILVIGIMGVVLRTATSTPPFTPNADSKNQ